MPESRYSEAFQVALAGLGAVFSAPVVLLAAAAIRTSTGEFPIFTQTRVGLEGVPFTFYKLRTMADVAGAGVTSAGDPRITPIGSILRKTKVDELPQLYNVLKRDMNLVGPRPELPSYVEHWPPEQRALILSVRPGITGMASIRYVEENALLARQEDPLEYYEATLTPIKTRIEAEYVATRSVRTDLHILVQTAHVVCFKTFKRKVVSRGP